MQQNLLNLMAAQAASKAEGFQSRIWYQEVMMSNLDKFTILSQKLEEFENKFVNHNVHLPFKIDCDRLAYLHPKERIEIRRISRSSAFYHEEVTNSNKLFFIQSIPTLFQCNKDIVTKSHFLELVKRWLNVVLIHYEYGYFDSSDLVPLLQTTKAAMRSINQVNNIKFVMFLYGWIRKFVKLVLYDLVDRFYNDLEGNPSKLEKIFDSLFPHPEQEKKLSFGKLTANFRKFNYLYEGIQQAKV